MLRETLNNAESRAHSAEDELKKAKERNATVRILTGFCSFTLAEMRLKLLHFIFSCEISFSLSYLRDLSPSYFQVT